LKAQPALVVAIPTTGVVFFRGYRAVLGNNTIGKVFVTTRDVLALSMKGVEMRWKIC